MKPDKLIARIGESAAARDFLSHSAPTISLEGVSGSLLSILIALKAQSVGGIHLAVVEDRDAASYLYNDIYNILGLYGPAEHSVYVLPTAYKRSVTSQREDPAGIAQRTAVLGAIAMRLEAQNNEPLVICTYPEALAEMVVSRQKLEGSTLKLSVAERVDIAFIEEMLQQYEFQKVDFVCEPGQYAIRGGIVDVFSFADNFPYRIELFGNEVESIRTFAVGTQLSETKLERVSIIPNLKNAKLADNRVTLAEYIGSQATLWITNAQSNLGRIDQTRTKLLEELEDPSTIDLQVTSSAKFILQTDKWKAVTAFGRMTAREAQHSVNFASRPQPAFSKNFELLAATIKSEAENGIQTYILSDNMAQIERLENVFETLGTTVGFQGANLTLHGGFGIEDLWLLTDHQIFDRYHKFKIHNQIDRTGGMTIAELNTLKVGDYVVHIDHGVGRFGGLVRQTDGATTREYIKLTYRDGDVLMVGVHNLHRVSKYKSGDTETPPPVHKLGGSAWAKLKATTKNKIKDMARELIALYAKRKASAGHAFPPDSYMQHELEASFIYEDTPDQMATTTAVKNDMEAPQPMDRLVCGDVGFGKTEIAIRAAFKAASDGKQVAVLVPTTVLSLQHYRTFSRRLKEFPVRIENFSRVKSAKQTSEILHDLKEGKVDILIGTHKLLGKNVEFKDLGLLVIDEEQKFGVANKEKLRSLKANIDTLTLSATPIPRTLQFSLMGARDMSLINTPPPNRQPVATEVHPFDEQILQDAIEYEVSRGGQVFFLHNRVQSIAQVAAMIRRLCPKVKVVVGHGQMPPQELEKVMTDFIYGEYDVFVATTIIESGIDIPNANTIIINNAHMFGLSDLHQLRGRVGRTNRKAFCYLFVPSMEGISSDAQRRLRAIEEFADLGSGFNIAMQDLDIRGAGNILGGEQSGFVSDIGFETYQKIINEAVMELRMEQGLEVEASTVDCYIESDSSAHLPDEYIGSTNEKIRLYKELDGMKTQAQLDDFVVRLTDRFGPAPTSALELFEVVMLRTEAEQIAVERIVMKNGVAFLYFSPMENLPFYKSDRFMDMLRKVSEQGSRLRLNQKDDKLSLTVRGIHTFKDLRQAIGSFL